MKQVTLGLTLFVCLLFAGACSTAEGQSEPPPATSAPTIAVAAPTPTGREAVSQNTPTGAADTAGLPDAIAALLPNANAIHGSELVQQYGCTACHSLEEGVKVVGPSWYNIGNVAATRVPGEDAPRYLYHSIIDPNQHVVEGFLPNLMPQTYADQLSDQDLADLMQYLLALKK